MKNTSMRICQLDIPQVDIDKLQLVCVCVCVRVCLNDTNCFKLFYLIRQIQLN